MSTWSRPLRSPERGIRVDEIRQHRGVYDSYVRLTVRTETLERSIAGTVFSDGKPRVIQIKGINMEAELGPYMLYVTNADKPGFIGAFGTILGDRGVNIATFISAATNRAAMPSRWSRSMARCRRRCSPPSRPCRR